MGLVWAQHVKMDGEKLIEDGQGQRVCGCGTALQFVCTGSWLPSSRCCFAALPQPSKLLINSAAFIRKEFICMQQVGIGSSYN